MFGMLWNKDSLAKPKLASSSLKALTTTMILVLGDDESWYVDTGAINHVTFGTTQLDSATPYNGTKTIVVGNGKKLLVSHIGQSTIPSYVYNQPIHLNYVLHVPSITKNLVSVSQLTTDNDVFLEFYKTFCFVKDKLTGTVLLKGKAGLAMEYWWHAISTDVFTISRLPTLLIEALIPSEPRNTATALKHPQWL
uniref:Retrovirus-related Pol polyprotein from transposon TNT 1-94-like beta-barrel domain-containing protein n=1 Tax=Cannabis sativa TaxID=3483 RepID=A0A803QI42_CANSA